MKYNKYWVWLGLLLLTLASATGVFASESDIHIPDLTQVKFPSLGGVSGATLMYLGLGICLIGAIFGWV